MAGCGNGAKGEPLRHRQTKEAANRYVQPTATAPHLDSTKVKNPNSPAMKRAELVDWSQRRGKDTNTG